MRKNVEFIEKQFNKMYSSPAYGFDNDLYKTRNK